MPGPNVRALVQELAFQRRGWRPRLCAPSDLIFDQVRALRPGTRVERPVRNSRRRSRKPKPPDRSRRRLRSHRSSRNSGCVGVSLPRRGRFSRVAGQSAGRIWRCGYGRRHGDGAAAMPTPIAPPRLGLRRAGGPGSLRS